MDNPDIPSFQESITQNRRKKIMSLDIEIKDKRRNIHSDGYPMSIGELANMYRDEELDIHPEFQRFFRWTNKQKSRLIESLLLGIPIPSIFVAQRDNGVWDVVDGLQRLSTILQFMGLLKDDKGKRIPRLVLESTEYLPSLVNHVWEDPFQEEFEIGKENQLIIKRSKIDIKIILRESDNSSKYDLFQRLNTGGSALSDQELRNCILVMINDDFYKWIIDLSKDQNFTACLPLTDRAIEQQYNVELVVRFLVLRQLSFTELRTIGEVGEFLTEGIKGAALNPSFNKDESEKAFKFTFQHFAEQLGENSFKKYRVDKGDFSGPFLISAFEALAIGLGANYQAYKSAGTTPDLTNKAKLLWQNPDFIKGTGNGIRGSIRVPVTIPLGKQLLQP